MLMMLLLLRRLLAAVADSFFAKFFFVEIRFGANADADDADKLFGTS